MNKMRGKERFTKKTYKKIIYIHNDNLYIYIRTYIICIYIYIRIYIHYFSCLARRTNSKVLLHHGPFPKYTHWACVPKCPLPTKKVSDWLSCDFWGFHPVPNTQRNRSFTRCVLVSRLTGLLYEANPQVTCELFLWIIVHHLGGGCLVAAWWLVGWLVGCLAAWLVGWCNASYAFCWKSTGPNKNNKSYSWSLGLIPCFTTTRQAVWSTWTCCSPVTLTSLRLAELEVKKDTFSGGEGSVKLHIGEWMYYIYFPSIVWWKNWINQMKLTQMEERNMKLWLSSLETRFSTDVNCYTSTNLTSTKGVETLGYPMTLRMSKNG